MFEEYVEVIGVRYLSQIKARLDRTARVGNLATNTIFRGYFQDFWEGIQITSIGLA